MSKKNVLIFFIAFLLVLGLQTGVNAQNPDLPKAPGWEFGWDGIELLMQIKPQVFWELQDKYANQNVLNSWGYKAGNPDEIEDLIPPPLYDILKHPEVWGNYRINETAYIPKSGKYWDEWMELTEKHKGGPYLDENGWLQNYKAGVPFPDVTENDPQAALKITWNWFRRMKTDDDLARDTTIDLVDRAGRHKFVVSSKFVMRFQGRLVHDPKPLLTPNPKHLDYVYASTNHKPYNVAGTIVRLNRYNVDGKSDDMWVYVTSLRRIRRMSVSERQDKMSGGKDYIWDGVETFDGAVADYNFELVETKTMLQPICSNNMPENVKDGYLNAPDDYWQRGKTYCIRATPKKPANISAIYYYVDAREFRSNLGWIADTRGRPWLYQQYMTNCDQDGGYGLIDSCAVDLITRHSSKNWVPWNKYCLGYTADDFGFNELKKRWLVR